MNEVSMHGYGTKTTAYRQTQILSSSRERLVPTLYEHLLVRLKRGAHQIRERDVDGKFKTLTQAQDILTELLSSLDFEAGGELAGRLASLYAYWMREVLQAGRDLDAPRLEQVARMVESLHEAWEEAARTLEVPGASSGSTGGNA